MSSKSPFRLTKKSCRAHRTFECNQRIGAPVEGTTANVSINDYCVRATRHHTKPQTNKHTELNDPKNNFNKKNNDANDLFRIPFGCVICKYSIDAIVCGKLGSVPTNKTQTITSMNRSEGKQRLVPVLEDIHFWTSSMRLMETRAGGM